MFYLDLANQFHLFIVVVFSSYIYLFSFSIKPVSAGVKHLCTVFFIPLVLCLMSFISLNREFSASYLFFAEFFLITALLLILLFERNGDFTYIIYFLLYALPLCIMILNPNLSTVSRSMVFNLGIGLYTAITAIVILTCVLSKHQERMPMHWGIFLLCASIGLPRLFGSGIATTFSLIIKAIGYILLAWFFYRTTVYRLQQEHEKSTTQLKRINDNVQREVTRRVEEIERSNQKLVEMAKTDSLTGAYTKKAIIDIMDSLIQKQPESVFSILMFDIDLFKKINDTHGHITGDKCIKNLMAIARSSFRSDDRLGRYGGDEFIIVLPATSPVKAYLVAERFRKNVEQTKDPHYTVSIGIASYPLDGKNSKQLINAADKALYISKEKGRNRVSHTGQLEE